MTICKDNVIHSVWECRVVNEFIAQIFNFLNTNTGTNLDIDRSRDDYIFGFSGSRYQALNLILLELKIFNFYSLHQCDHKTKRKDNLKRHIDYVQL